MQRRTPSAKDDTKSEKNALWRGINSGFPSVTSQNPGPALQKAGNPSTAGSLVILSRSVKAERSSNSTQRSSQPVFLSRVSPATQSNHSRCGLPRKFHEVWPNPELLCFGPKGQQFTSLGPAGQGNRPKTIFQAQRAGPMPAWGNAPGFIKNNVHIAPPGRS